VGSLSITVKSLLSDKGVARRVRPKSAIAEICTRGGAMGGPADGNFSIWDQGWREGWHCGWNFPQLGSVHQNGTNSGRSEDACGSSLLQIKPRSSTYVLRHRKGKFRRYVGALLGNIFDEASTACGCGLHKGIADFPQMWTDPKSGTFRPRCQTWPYLWPQFVNVPPTVPSLAPSLAPLTLRSTECVTPQNEADSKSATITNGSRMVFIVGSKAALICYFSRKQAKSCGGS
jgi:hypothetical protein